MEYISTRGGMPPLRFSDILLGGLAPDGGLVMPASIPQIDNDTLQGWRSLSYAQLAFQVLSRYCDDIPADDLKRLVEETYTAETFGTRAITPLTELEAASAERGSLLVQHLSNGPTLAFKDLAMQLLGRLFEYTLLKQDRWLNIVGATSGDTGSAAEYAMRGRQRLRVFMLSPAGRMSAFQRAQMFSLMDDNIHNIAIEGVFDDCQDLVKALASDLPFKKRHHIGSVNSINWARVVAQVVYYFRGYLQATAAHPIDANGRPAQVSFTVPSGNFGNVLAGHIARRMGLPIRRLVVATNENDVLDEFFRTGRYRVRSARETHATSSPSMDISKASNFERFVFDLLDGDAERLKALWQQLGQTGEFDLSGTDAFARAAQWGFVSGSSCHADRLQTIRKWHDDRGVLVDTHTADGLKVAQQYREPGIPMICLETALPAKFAESIVEATGQQPPVPEALADLEHRVQRYVRMPADAALLKAYVAART